MAWKSLALKFVGSRPLLMHSGRLADPLDEFTRAIQKVSKKWAKTEADHEQMAKLEFLGGFWLAGEPLRPVLPDTAIHACLIAGAKKTRNGPAAKAGLLCEQHATLEYDGPSSPEELWEDKRFRFRTGVRVQQARIMRMRPIFHDWQATVNVEYEDSLLDEVQVVGFAQRAGFEAGIGDGRPRYGRFTAELVA